MDPEEGVSHNTTFSLTASGFHDDDAPVMYQFFVEKPKKRGQFSSTLSLGKSYFDSFRSFPCIPFRST